MIVESPAKAKTIEKFLGTGYKVASSFGHIADLPARELGVDIDQDFLPKYEVSSDKKKVVSELKKLAQKAETVWLASDEDREGEAIAWHLAQNLKLKPEKTKRIVFHEITKNAILRAIDNPREIDYNLVNAQQARRVLDRLVGYELSPVLWRKVKPGLSAGRVQSVAVRLIVEREREIKEFAPEQAFKTQAVFLNLENKSISGTLNHDFENAEAAEAFLELSAQSRHHLAALEKKPAKKSPTPPFTTSTLQQEAARKLYFSVSKTMTLAQRLYESGLITYMRTDSVNLSKEAQGAILNQIEDRFGANYVQPRNFNTKNKAISPNKKMNSKTCKQSTRCIWFVQERSKITPMAIKQSVSANSNYTGWVREFPRNDNRLIITIGTTMTTRILCSFSSKWCRPNLSFLIFAIFKSSGRMPFHISYF